MQCDAKYTGRMGVRVKYLKRQRIMLMLFQGRTQTFNLHMEKSLQVASCIIVLLVTLTSNMVEEGN